MIEINRHPSQRDLRWFGLLQLPFFALISWGLYRRTGSLLLVESILAVSLILAVIGLLSPARLRLVYVGWMLAVFPIGWVVSHVLLAAIFYLVITPVGLLLRCAGYDPMQRKFDRTAKTYWVTRPEPPAMNRYFRQF